MAIAITSRENGSLDLFLLNDGLKSSHGIIHSPFCLILIHFYWWTTCLRCGVIQCGRSYFTSFILQYIQPPNQQGSLTTPVTSSTSPHALIYLETLLMVFSCKTVQYIRWWQTVRQLKQSTAPDRVVQCYSRLQACASKVRPRALFVLGRRGL